MTVARPLVPAVGGTRQVPEPDAIARDYLLLGLRLDQHAAGSRRWLLRAGGAQGPGRHGAARARPRACATTPWRSAPAWPARSPSRIGGRGWTPSSWPSRRRPPALAGDAAAVRRRTSRAAWGSRRHVGPTSSSTRPARAGRGAAGSRRRLTERLEAWDRTMEIPLDRLPAVIDGLVARFRARAAADFGLPEGEDLRVRLVTGQPWSGYNWFDGGRRSRVDDQHRPAGPRALARPHGRPRDVPRPPPGARLEGSRPGRATRGRLEASILLINTPECPISEGLADLGVRFADPPPDRVDLLVETVRASRAGDRRPIRAPPAEAERAVAIGTHRDHARRGAWQRGLSAPRRRREPRGGPRLPRSRSVASRRPSPPSASSSSSTRCGGRTSSSTPRARRSCDRGWRRCRPRRRPRGSGGSSTSRSRRRRSSRRRTERDLGLTRPAPAAQPGHQEPGGAAGQDRQQDDADGRSAGRRRRGRRPGGVAASARHLGLQSVVDALGRCRSTPRPQVHRVGPLAHVARAMRPRSRLRRVEGRRRPVRGVDGERDRDRRRRPAPGTTRSSPRSRPRRGRTVATKWPSGPRPAAGTSSVVPEAMSMKWTVGVTQPAGVSPCWRTVKPISIGWPSTGGWSWSPRRRAGPPPSRRPGPARTGAGACDTPPASRSRRRVIGRASMGCVSPSVHRPPRGGSPPRSEVEEEHHPILAVPVVVDMGRRAVDRLGAGPVVDARTRPTDGTRSRSGCPARSPR